MWALNPFSSDGKSDADVLLELKVDGNQKAFFQTFPHPMDF